MVCIHVLQIQPHSALARQLLRAREFSFSSKELYALEGVLAGDQEESKVVAPQTAYTSVFTQTRVRTSSNPGGSGIEVQRVRSTAKMKTSASIYLECVFMHGAHVSLQLKGYPAHAPPSCFRGCQCAQPPNQSRGLLGVKHGAAVSF